MFLKKVYDIMKRLNENVNKDEIMKSCLQEKLRISLINYKYDINSSYNCLSRRSNKRILKELSKEIKEKKDD